MSDRSRERRSSYGSSSHYDGRDRPRHHDSKGRHSSHHSQHDGDWICSGCGNNNFARRKQCNKCGQEKSHTRTKSGGIEIGKQLAEKSKGLFAADDWQCKMCGNVNWSRRNECNVCKSPKVGCVESRTGYGGGFNERDNVEYNEKQDSDGEFDEFGRKKKKFRGKQAEEQRDIKNTTNNSSNEEEDDEEEEEEEEDEEDEEDGNSDAYKLSEDEEEDDDNDVSAYDLGESDDEATNKTESKETETNSQQFAKSSDAEQRESPGHSDRQRKRTRSRSRSNEREIKKFAES